MANNNVSYGLIVPPNSATPNGMTIQDKTTGVIQNNVFTGFQSPFPGVVAVGILPFTAGSNLMILNNTTTQNDVGISCFQVQDNLIIENNQSNNNTTMASTGGAIGIVVQDPAGLHTSLIGNTVANNASIGIQLDSASSPINSPDNPAPIVFTIVPNPQFFMSNNTIIGGQTGLLVVGSVTAGPVVSIIGGSFSTKLPILL